MIIQPMNVARGRAARLREVMTMVKTILHIGAHRCATTTFQSYLNRNRLALSAGGITAWTPRRTRDLFSGMTGDPDKAPHKADRGKGLIAIETARLPQSGLLLVSEENMIGAVRNNLRRGVLYPQLAARIVRFRDAFGDQVSRIGLSIRPYDTYWASSYGFAVPRGHQLPDATQIAQLVAQPRRWRDIITEIKQVFPSSQLIVWNHAEFAAYPQALFTTLTGGCTAPNNTDGYSRNRSPSAAELQAISYGRGDTNAAQLPRDHTPWMPFDTVQRFALQSQFQADVDWLQAGADGLATYVTRAAAPAISIKQKTNNLTVMKVIGRMSRELSAPLPTIGGRYGTENTVV